jgi:hypothetical protein
MIRDGVVRLRLSGRELWCDWKVEYERPRQASSGEADGRVDFHFRGYDPERKIVAATLKRIAEELDPDPNSPV